MLLISLQLFQDGIKAAYEYKLNPTDIADQIMEELELHDLDEDNGSECEQNGGSDGKQDGGDADQQNGEGKAPLENGKISAEDNDGASDKVEKEDGNGSSSS